MNIIENRRNQIFNNDLYYFSDSEVNEIELESLNIINPFEYLDYVIAEESIGSNIKEKGSKIVNKIKELWKKFKAWVKNIFRVVTTMFMSGEKLVKKYNKEIREEYTKKKDVITFNSYIYELKASGLNNLSNKLVEMRDFAEDIDQEKLNEQIAEDCVRDGKKTDHELSEIPVNTIIDFLSNGKQVIKNIKNLEKGMDKKFAQAIHEANSGKSFTLTKSGEDIKNMNFESQTTTTDLTKALSMCNKAYRSLIKEIKTGLKTYHAIVRQLLDSRIKGVEGVSSSNDTNNEQKEKDYEENRKNSQKSPEEVKKMMDDAMNSKSDGWKPEEFLVNAIKKGDKMDIKVAISLYIDKGDVDSKEWKNVIDYVDKNGYKDIWEEYKEIEPLRPKSEWNIDYLGILQSDLMHNFSKKRLRDIFKVNDYIQNKR